MAQERMEGDRGASVVEYALLLALIALVCFVAIEYFGQVHRASLGNSGSQITNAN